MCKISLGIPCKRFPYGSPGARPLNLYNVMCTRDVCRENNQVTQEKRDTVPDQGNGVVTFSYTLPASFATSWALPRAPGIALVR
jgi:hypothetical protein